MRKIKKTDIDHKIILQKQINMGTILKEMNKELLYQMFLLEIDKETNKIKQLIKT